MTLLVDPKNAMHRASFWIEQRKRRIGASPGVTVGQVEDDTVEWMRSLLEELDVESVTPAQLVEAVHFYGESWQKQVAATTGFLLPEIITKSIWLDGMQHGMALAKGMELDAPPD